VQAQDTVVESIETQLPSDLTLHGVLAKRASAERLVCLMPAAQTGTGARRAKLFSRWSWQALMPKHHVLALSDPALGLDDDIRGAWYLHPTDDLLEQMAALIRQQIERLGLTNEQVLFYGSSLGGFGSLSMASLIPGSSAIAEIPQIDVARWPSPGSIKAMESKILGRGFAEQKKLLPATVDVRARFEKSNLIPPFVIVSNATDMSIGIQFELMAEMHKSKLPKLGQQRILLAEHVAGHSALPQKDALSLIEAWSENASLNNLGLSLFR
jgi:hypothetical protein